jgi:hypothetical protein
MRLEFRNISSPASCPLMLFCPRLKTPNYYQQIFILLECPYLGRLSPSHLSGFCRLLVHVLTNLHVFVLDYEE